MSTSISVSVHPDADDIRIINLNDQVTAPLVVIRLGEVSLLFGAEQVNALDTLEQAIVEARAAFTQKAPVSV